MLRGTVLRLEGTACRWTKIWKGGCLPQCQPPPRTLCPPQVAEERYTAALAHLKADSMGKAEKMLAAEASKLRAMMEGPNASLDAIEAELKRCGGCCGRGPRCTGARVASVLAVRMLPPFDFARARLARSCSPPAFPSLCVP